MLEQPAVISMMLKMHLVESFFCLLSLLWDTLNLSKGADNSIDTKEFLNGPNWSELDKNGQKNLTNLNLLTRRKRKQKQISIQGASFSI